MLLNNFVFSRQKTGFEKFFGGKMFTAKRVVFSGKNFFLAPSLPENFHLRNEKFWNVGGAHQACRLVILVPSS